MKDAHLEKCGRTDCDPVVQVRGEMGHGDYVDVLSDKDVGDPDAYHERVELHDENKGDFRVMCRVCGLAAPWNKRSAKLPTGHVVDLSNQPDSPLLMWPQMIARRDKIAQARKLLREAGVPGVGDD